MSQNSGWAIFWEILLDLTRSLIAALMAYVAWRATSPDWFYFGFLAALCAFAAVKRLGHALVGIAKLILAAGIWARFKRRGTTPKADPIATSDDLRRRGLTK